MNKKINVGILFGGRSVEHEVSVQSAKNVYDAMNKEKYNITMIGLTKDGKWILNPELTEDGIVKDNGGLAVVPGIEGVQVIDPSNRYTIEKLDVVFPILHGPYGEDGTVQGLMKLLNIPFVGPGVLGSAVGMDKEVMKKLLKVSELPSADYVVMYRCNGQIKNPSFGEVTSQLGLPIFVKPANLGSSVGISKVNNEMEYNLAIEQALQYDMKVIVEKFIKGREIECSVLGNEEPIASLPGEVKSNHGFYSYEAKYLDEHGAILEIPAKLPEHIVKNIQDIAVKTFKALYCEGLTRVDFFLTEDEKILINEVNTIPGFTKISMYPKLWEVTGISYTDLIDRLIELAIQRFEKEKQLKTSI